MTILKHVMSGTLPAGDIWVTGFHVDTTASIDAGHSTWEGWTDTFWNGGGGSGYKTLCNAGVVFASYATYELATVFPYKTVQSRFTIVSHAGTDAAASLPQETAPLISLSTNTPGPKGRGRMYLPPTAVDTIATNGSLSTATQDAIEAMAANAWTTTNVPAWFPVIFSRTLGVSTVIEFFNVPQVLAIQRRRANKVGRIRAVEQMPGT